MKNTRFSVSAKKFDRLATCYKVAPETGVLELYDGVNDSQWSGPPAFPDAGRDLVSTIDDYLAEGQMVLKEWKRGSALPVQTFGRDHDDRPADALAEGGSGLIPRGQPRLGIRRIHGHQARRRGVGAWTVRLGRRLGHLLVFGPLGGHGRDADDPMPGLPVGDRSQFLDLDISDDRRPRLTYAPMMRCAIGARATTTNERKEKRDGC